MLLSSLSFWPCTSCSPLPATELPRRSLLLPQPESSLSPPAMNQPYIPAASSLCDLGAHQYNMPDPSRLGRTLSRRKEGCQDPPRPRSWQTSGYVAPIMYPDSVRRSAVSELHEELFLGAAHESPTVKSHCLSAAGTIRALGQKRSSHLLNDQGNN